MGQCKSCLVGVMLMQGFIDIIYTGDIIMELIQGSDLVKNNFITHPSAGVGFCNPTIRWGGIL